jgi:hypothetical protein
MVAEGTQNRNLRFRADLSVSAHAASQHYSRRALCRRKGDY